MASAQGPELAIAVCQAGGLGSLPAAMLTPDRLREQIATIRNATSAPFNVNFFCHAEPAPDPKIEARWRNRLAPYYAEAGIDPSAIPAGPVRAPFDAALCAVIEETRPAVVSFHFGLPPAELLSRVKATAALILSSATTVAEARWLEQRGVDAVIAQGREAGGHRGMFLSDDIGAQPGLISLLPQVRDAVRLPVVAAGGISDGRGIAAAFALGADAVQIGTAFPALGGRGGGARARGRRRGADAQAVGGGTSGVVGDDKPVDVTDRISARLGRRESHRGYIQEIATECHLLCGHLYSKSSIVGEERTNPIVIIAKEDQFLGAPHNALIYFPDNSSRCHDGAPPESWKRRVSTRASAVRSGRILTAKSGASGTTRPRVCPLEGSIAAGKSLAKNGL
jgi:nitronate monooxygenase